MLTLTSRVVLTLGALVLACSLCALVTGWAVSGSTIVRLTPNEIFRPAP